MVAPGDSYQLWTTSQQEQLWNNDAVDPSIFIHGLHPILPVALGSTFSCFAVDANEIP